ncbi:unnamed protein product [Heterotrigona itama]|uniref:Mitochondrial pyruvate carrier n=1 Tax=Heterotrigona itama TaxID=395501 RepID=A0A6V7GXG2_9HYME|nr:unnamed protein product [Heterotrigona itama]
MSSSKKQSAYQRLMLQISCLLPAKFRPLFLHPAGPTTIFFWAPTFKWGLVIAGLGDMNRPPDTISLYQTASLMITGAIWSRSDLNKKKNSLTDCLSIRYSLIITPKNYNLLSVNAFTCMTGTYNFARALLYKIQQEKAKEKDSK